MQFSLVENSAKERLHFIEFLICRPLPDSVLTFNEYIVTVFYLGSITLQSIFMNCQLSPIDVVIII